MPRYTPTGVAFVRRAWCSIMASIQICRALTRRSVASSRRARHSEMGTWSVVPTRTSSGCVTVCLLLYCAIGLIIDQAFIESKKESKKDPLYKNFK